MINEVMEETVQAIQPVEPILDDGGLVRLLKLPADANLKHYRDRSGLPYVTFKQAGKPFYRYVTAQVLRWMVDRQRHGKPEDGGQ